VRGRAVEHEGARGPTPLQAHMRLHYGSSAICKYVTHVRGVGVSNYYGEGSKIFQKKLPLPPWSASRVSG
jgi:hypothetical protein